MWRSPRFHPWPTPFSYICIYDISNSITENILSFADYTTVFLSDADQASLFNRANSSLEAILSWLCANKLTLNATKTQNIVIQSTTKSFRILYNNQWCNFDPIDLLLISRYDNRRLILLKKTTFV